MKSLRNCSDTMYPIAPKQHIVIGLRRQTTKRVGLVTVPTLTDNKIIPRDLDVFPSKLESTMLCGLKSETDLPIFFNKAEGIKLIAAPPSTNALLIPTSSTLAHM